MADNDITNAFKEAFDVWEKHTAQFWDQALRSPLFLEALDENLRASLGFQRMFQQALDLTWRTWGLPTRRDQELTLHRLNRLESQTRQLSRRVERLLAQRGSPPTPIKPSRG